MLYGAACDKETVVHGHSPNHRILCPDRLAGGIQACEDVTRDDGLLTPGDQFRVNRIAFALCCVRFM
jgi:hypothetical protein